MALIYRIIAAFRQFHLGARTAFLTEKAARFSRQRVGLLLEARATKDFTTWPKP